MGISEAQLALVVVSDETPKNLHPREWAVLQTGLTNAQRVALTALASGYGGFQLEYGEFYIVEARVAEYLSISYRTFRNYLTDLRKLGLLELVSRSPNQYGRRSVWRMRLDVTCRTAQVHLPLLIEDEASLADAVLEELDPAVEASEDGVESDVDADWEARDESEVGSELQIEDEQLRESEMPAPSAAHLWSDSEHEAFVNSETERLLSEGIMAIRSEVRVSRAKFEAGRRALELKERRLRAGFRSDVAVGPAPAAPVWDLPRAEKRRREKAERKAAHDTPLLVALKEALRARGLAALSRADRRKALKVDREWRDTHGSYVPDDVTADAVEIADERARTNFAGLVIKVISDRLDSYTTGGWKEQLGGFGARQKRTRY